LNEISRDSLKIDVSSSNKIRKMAAITKFERLKKIREKAPPAVRHFLKAKIRDLPANTGDVTCMSLWEKHI
jgi:hypothetical protein